MYNIVYMYFCLYNNDNCMFFVELYNYSSWKYAGQKEHDSLINTLITEVANKVGWHVRVYNVRIELLCNTDLSMPLYMVPESSM